MIFSVKNSFLNTLILRNSSFTSFCWRTHTCGELRSTHVGKSVILGGWLQFQRMGKFLTLRDGHGVTQLIVSENNEKTTKILDNLAFESVLKVKGKVLKRPQDQINPKMITGEIEVEVHELEVLNDCKRNLPFPVREFQKTRESLRLQYRYLDLRSKEMQYNLRMRSKMLMKMREFLCNIHEFVEVETPTLFRKTPGGAQEFVVPTRLEGQFYSLVQSPQQLKQLLMVGSIDRYFQICRCYRDEGSKPDRQPEFTQVDLEMSFVTDEDIINLVEQLLHYSWPFDKTSIKFPFPRLSYADAMRLYGTDKPDTRFELFLNDLTEFVPKMNLQMFVSATTPENTTLQALVVPKGLIYFSKPYFLETDKVAIKNHNLKGIVPIIVQRDLTWKSNTARHVPKEIQQNISKHCNAQPDDYIVLCAGPTIKVQTFLGRLRVAVAKHLQSSGMKIYDEAKFQFLWIVDFPLFLQTDEGTLESAHHPFTAPKIDEEDMLKTVPSMVKGQHYDLVLNGHEIGGGSIRIHSAEVQKYVLRDILKEDTSPVQHLIDALESGCPPHGGIALGLDRLMSIICNASSIRDVIAFPKTTDGKDLLSGAPSNINNTDYNLYHLTKK